MTIKDSAIDAYIAQQDEWKQAQLNLMKDTLRIALPEAHERISWGMPSYGYKRNIIHFAAHKHHMGLYPGPKAITVFADRLVEYKSSKGAVQFSYNEPLPQELITDIAQWCNTVGDKA